MTDLVPWVFESGYVSREMNFAVGAASIATRRLFSGVKF